MSRLNIPSEIIFNLGASANASTFCECMLAETDVFCHFLKCQVKPHLSLWRYFLVISYGNLFFELCEQNKLTV